MNDLPVRKPNRLANYDYSQCGAYFITICTKDKKHILWKDFPAVGGDAHIAPYDRLSEIGLVVDKYINSTPGVEKYVIMPNHLHLIIVISPESGAMWASPPTNQQSVSQIIKTLKILVTKEIGFPIWQRSFYDRIIRDRHEYDAYWRYIENNPVNWENDELFNGWR